MIGVFIRLAGPLQSWAGPKLAGNFSRTEMMPTARALEGLTAAALGLHRGERPEWFDRLTFDVRCDSVGEVIDEFHTINPTPEDLEYRMRMLTLLKRKVATPKSTVFTPDGQASTAIAKRTFLSDAEFIVGVSAEGHIEELDAAFASPKFVPYLGRKAFSPGFPFYLGSGNMELLEQIPLFQPGYRDSEWWLAAQANRRAVREGSYEPEEKVMLKVVRRSTSGLDSAEQVTVPTVGDRAVWLSRVAELPGLHRRKTVNG